MITHNALAIIDVYRKAIDELSERYFDVDDEQFDFFREVVENIPKAIINVQTYRTDGEG